MIHKHFHLGRDLYAIKHHCVLGIVPSSSAEDVKKAFKSMSRKFHPDKCNDPRRLNDFSKKCQQIELAKEELLRRTSRDINRSSRPFDHEIQDIGSQLRQDVKKALGVQDYDYLESVLSKLEEIGVLKSLVHPPLDTDEIRSGLIGYVKDHVSKVRLAVEGMWSDRNYKDLNLAIEDLKEMEKRFSPNIVDRSWSSDGIDKKIRGEIEEMASNARRYLQDRRTAKTHHDEFRRCFIGLGKVMLELPVFRDETKRVMSDLLESCLMQEWGHGFLFEFGNGLHKGREGETNDDLRVSRIILDEFRCFKDVTTMIWNEEVLQMPIEVTMKGIRVEQLGDGIGDQQKLPEDMMTSLGESFHKYDAEYKSLLGEYLQPHSDLKEIVQRIKALIERVKPVTCQTFGTKVKGEIPIILAHIFALFTVLKSGESYSRLEESQNDDDFDPKKVLMQPHNIQIQTLLSMFGCEDPSLTSLKSQLMEIRTGEGKSMVLGAASTLLALLGFKVRCVCYSEYLSSRDYDAFREVFEWFGIVEYVTYSKITSLSEDTTAAKGDIRDLTLSLLKENVHLNSSSRPSVDLEPSAKRPRINERETKTTVDRRSTTPLASLGIEEILLLDEADVFFSSEFYGNTYNKVALLKCPEIQGLLIEIWSASNQGQKKLRLQDVKPLPQYQSLLRTLCGFEFLVETEIERMLEDVHRVDEIPYHLDITKDRIGFKIMDTIAFDVHFGYRKCFAYLREADKLSNRDETLGRELGMLVPCGCFSYANISPAAILGVSGTLEVMGDYQKTVLKSYGLNCFSYAPSVYAPNFTFDKAAEEAVSIERSLKNYFLKIVEVLVAVTRKKRAGIVFFKDTERLIEFVNSPFYRKLGRNKATLTEDMTTADKESVVQRAATAGQITISTAVFGRGTDFFCKDETVESNGGVHVVQAFLSAELSEELQIQGRTARQGKKGTYSMVVLDEDLQDSFGVNPTSIDDCPARERYKFLTEIRNKQLDKSCNEMESNLKEATAKDTQSHEYFNALLRNDTAVARNLFQRLYLSMKKAKAPENVKLDVCFAIDNTGSMLPYSHAIKSMIAAMVNGENSFSNKLKHKFPHTTFEVRLGLLAYKDLDDGNSQFLMCTPRFMTDPFSLLRAIDQVITSASGGGDVCEDHLGAIQYLVNLEEPGCWESELKFILLVTDAPCHGHLPATFSEADDTRSGSHPLDLTVESVASGLIRKNMDLFLCSLDQAATLPFEEAISTAYNCDGGNAEERRIATISLLPNSQDVAQQGSRTSNRRAQQHTIFVLDESGSMKNYWGGVVGAYNNYKNRRLARQFCSDMVSVVQFDSRARDTVSQASLADAPAHLDFHGGGTKFAPAAEKAYHLALQTPSSHIPTVIFMSDGAASDWQRAVDLFKALNREVSNSYGGELVLHVIGFSDGAETGQLQAIAGTSSKGSLHTASDIEDLSNTFVQIAENGGNIVDVLEEEIGKRLYDAVSDRVRAEYSG